MEYNLAINLFTHSHEQGRTKRGEKRLPYFIPLALQGLDWNSEQVMLMSATINFLVSRPDMDEATLLKTIYTEIVKSDLIPKLSSSPTGTGASTLIQQKPSSGVRTTISPTPSTTYSPPPSTTYSPPPSTTYSPPPSTTYSPSTSGISRTSSSPSPPSSPTKSNEQILEELKTKPLGQYTNEDVCNMIRAIGLVTLVDGFRENAVNGEMLLNMSDKEYTEELHFQKLQLKRLHLHLEKLPM